MLVLAWPVLGVTYLSHIPLGACSASSVSQLPLESLLGDLGLGGVMAVPAPCCLAYNQWQKALREWHECIPYTDTKLDTTKTWASVTKQEEVFCVTEVKKKVSFETLVSRDSDPFHSFCSCIDSGTKGSKQITLYLADSFHLLISRSLSYCLAIGPGTFLQDLKIWRVCVQPPRRGILHVIEEAANLLQVVLREGR